MDYFSKQKVVKVDKFTYAISDLLTNDPLILPFFSNSSHPIIPYAWQTLLDRLFAYGFEKLPMKRIYEQIRKLQGGGEKSQEELLLHVNNLLRAQSDFSEVARYPVFPSWQPKGIYQMGSKQFVSKYFEYVFEEKKILFLPTGSRLQCI